MPLTSAAKRGEVFCRVPMMVALPRQTPDCSTNLREIDPLSAREPASARPNPSKMDFLPRSITSAGMSSYLVIRMNVPTYFVRPGTCGNSANSGRAAWPAESGNRETPRTPSEALPKSRLRIFHHQEILGLNVVNTYFRIFAFMMVNGKIVSVPFRHENSRLGAKSTGNSGRQSIVIGIFLLENVERAVPGQIDALILRVIG